MPRYFFDIRSNDSVQIDDEGSELCGPDVAAVEAKKTLAQVVRDNLSWPQRRQLAIVVRDEGGAAFEVEIAFEVIVGSWAN
jgi:hypothetical protein